jgi:hypothetical protein
MGNVKASHLYWLFIHQILYIVHSLNFLRCVQLHYHAVMWTFLFFFITSSIFFITLEEFLLLRHVLDNATNQVSFHWFESQSYLCGCPCIQSRSTDKTVVLVMYHFLCLCFSPRWCIWNIVSFNRLPVYWLNFLQKIAGHWDWIRQICCVHHVITCQPLILIF